MSTSASDKHAKPKGLQLSEETAVFTELKRGVYAALETYSNVHRGSGHYSMVSTHLFEYARNIVLEYMGLDKRKYLVIFCTPRRAKLLKAYLKPENYQSLSSKDIGLPLGIRALAVSRGSLPSGIPFQTGGGTANLVAPNWVVWAKSPDKFEAGTPAIINIIAFAKALQLFRHFGNNAFQAEFTKRLTAHEILYHDELEDYAGRELLYKLKQTLIGSGICVPTMEGIKPFINLDNGASTSSFKPVWDAVYVAWQQPGLIQKEIINEVKSICARALDAPLDTYEVVFTSNTTEAINLAAESIRNEPSQDIEPVVLNTILEHNSNELPWRAISGSSLVRLSVDSNGFINENELETILNAYNHEGKHGRKRIKLVTISGASNVLGVYNDLAKIGKIVHRYEARLLVDAAQLVAHRKVAMKSSEIDYLAFSAHKVYAPFGTGVLVVRKGLLTFNTDEMELIQSSGEENIGGIAALGKSLVLLQRIGMDLIQEEEQVLTAQLLQGIKQIPGVKLFGIQDENSPGFTQKGGVIVFEIKGMMANQVAPKLAELGAIGVRYGCHCTHIIIKRLLQIGPALERFQRVIVTLFPNVKLPGVTRISLGIGNNKEDVEAFIKVLNRIARKSEIIKNSNYEETGTTTLSRKEFRKQLDDFIRTATTRVYDSF